MPTEASGEAAQGAAAGAARGGALNMGVKLGGAGLALGLNIMLARTMTAEGFAQVSVALAWIAVLTALGTLSMPLLVVRFVGDYRASGRPDLARGIVVFAMVCAAVAMLALSATGAAWLAVEATLAPAARTVAWWALLLLAPTILLGVTSGVLQAFDRAVAAETLNSVLRPVLVGAGVLLAWNGMGSALAADLVVGVNVAVTLAVLGAAMLLVWRTDRRHLRGVRPTFEVRHWLHAAAGLLAVLLAVALNERLDLLLLAWRAPAEQVAPYAVAQRFAQTVLLALNAVAAVMAPRFVASLPAWRAGDGAGAEAIAKSGGRLALAASAVAWLVFAIAGPWIMLLFGPGYEAAHLPLLILVGGQVIACLFGPALLLATLTGNVKLALGSLACGMTANALLNWWVVPSWGGVGAAVATAAGAVVTAAVAHRLVGRRLRISISVLPGRGGRLPQLQRGSA